MGQGQEVHARRIISQSMAEGGFVLLQNCHLGLDYMDELLDTVTTVDPVHQSFRCWITTEIHPKFPINLLQVGMLPAHATCAINALRRVRYRDISSTDSICCKSV